MCGKVIGDEAFCCIWGAIQILFVAQENTVHSTWYTMQSSITDVCLSHAACTEQKSPRENTCTTV